MKKLLCLTATSLLLTSAWSAEQLQSFDQIRLAVSTGKLIRILTNYEKCTTLSATTMQAKAVANHFAVFTPNALAIDVNGDIGSYLLYFTLKDPMYPNRAVYQHGSYRISKDNTLSVTFASLNAADYTPLGNAVTINCKLNEGFKVFVSRRD